MRERARTASFAVHQVADLRVDAGRRTVSRNGGEIALPKLSFDLLSALIDAAPNVVSVEALMEQVWPGLVVGPETVIQRVELLRDALGDDPRSPKYLAGVRGLGYRLIAPVTRLPPSESVLTPANAAPEEPEPMNAASAAREAPPASVVPTPAATKAPPAPAAPPPTATEASPAPAPPPPAARSARSALAGRPKSLAEGRLYGLTLDKDPLWDPVRANPWFAAILKNYDDETSKQHSLLLKLRSMGEVPPRPNAAQAMRGAAAGPRLLAFAR